MDPESNEKKSPHIARLLARQFWRAPWALIEVGADHAGLRARGHTLTAGDAGAWLIDENDPTPEGAYEHAELLARVHAAVGALPTLERTVIRGLYVEDRCLDDIGAEIGASRSWASRIHTRAIEMLKERLAT